MIEQALADNTAAIQENTRALAALLQALTQQEQPVPLQKLQALVLEKAKTRKADVAAILAQYGARSASTVDEAHRAAVVQALEAL